MAFRKLKSLLKTVLSSSVSREYGFHELKEAVKFYHKNQSAGKVLIKASLIPENYSPKLWTNHFLISALYRDLPSTSRISTFTSEAVTVVRR